MLSEKKNYKDQDTQLVLKNGSFAKAFYLACEMADEQPEEYIDLPSDGEDDAATKGNSVDNAPQVDERLWEESFQKFCLAANENYANIANALRILTRFKSTRN